MTRIVAGAFGGRRLATPPGRATRPTSDRVREALFSSLTTLLEFPGARVADLYAGSGAIGFEALSRGAGHALFVESDSRAVTTLRRNIAALGVSGAAHVSPCPVERALATPPAEPYDLVFADPPYAVTDARLAVVLAALPANGWLATDAILLVERSSRSSPPRWPAGVETLRSRRYGETTLWYGRRS